MAVSEVPYYGSSIVKNRDDTHQASWTPSQANTVPILADVTLNSEKCYEYIRIGLECESVDADNSAHLLAAVSVMPIPAAVSPRRATLTLGLLWNLSTRSCLSFGCESKPRLPQAAHEYIKAAHGSRK